ncbi:YjiH family protein [Oceanobacillus senegalensis]|uniref:YjiH family protein n=1 Tax=Oceanobacillus senegalensis TaxID=1936063 RepID=UPI000A30B0AE|nr:nucleoside recognition domain-containing protein [Oceanobacillus senegalensis]
MKSASEIQGVGKNNIQAKEGQPIAIDRINLNRKEYSIGLTRALFFTSIALMIFFIPLTIDGKTEILFGFIYNFLIDLFGIVGVWLLSIITTGNALAFVFGRLIAKGDSNIKRFYAEDSFVHLFIYVLASVYSILYTLHASFGLFNGADIIVGSATGEVIIGIALQVKWVIILGAIFIPFLLNYGSIDFVGTIVEPIMRPFLKVPGKSAVDAISSFMTSSSVAVLITNELYKSKVYTAREATIIATCFSAVSVGFAAVVIDTAGLMEHFVTVFFSSLLIAFIVAFIAVRIPPWSKKSNVYIDGTAQTEKDRLGSEKFERGMLKKATHRFVKQGYVGGNIFKETSKSLSEGLVVLPKVMCMLIAIGITCLIIAENTPVFDWIGTLFIPLLQILNVPNAVEISPAITVGIAEMFLPVLFIADMVGSLDIGARYFITALSMVQIIFFSETGAVIMSTKLPVKLWELVVIFFIRTIIAIPIVALFMHILF